MPIISPGQLGQEKRELTRGVPRMTVVYFDEARKVSAAQQRSTVIEQCRRFHADGTLRLTSVLNEAEPYRTMALEHLTGNQGSKHIHPYPYQLLTFRLKHRGQVGWKLDAVGNEVKGEDGKRVSIVPPIKVVTERLPIAYTRSSAVSYNDDGAANPGQQYVRLYGDWMPGHAIDLPVEQAVGMLHKHGWWVSWHLADRIRRKYRMIVELDRDGNEVMFDGSSEESSGGGEHVMSAAEEAERNTEARGNGFIPASLLQAEGDSAA